MLNLVPRVRAGLAPQAGVGLVEYALILVLLAIVLLSVLSLLGGRAQNVFQSIVRDVVG